MRKEKVSIQDKITQLEIEIAESYNEADTSYIEMQLEQMKIDMAEGERYNDITDLQNIEYANNQKK